MPKLIEHIDAIARKEQSGVLRIRFYSRDMDLMAHEYRQDPERQRVLNWLDEHDIFWLSCGHVANENCMTSYRGEVHVDLPYDTTNPTYQVLQVYLGKSGRDDATSHGSLRVLPSGHGHEKCPPR